MFSNASSAVLLTLAHLGFSDMYVYPVFLCLTLTYTFIMFCNFMVAKTIAWNKKLHKPMFILLFNLPICEMVSATAFFPQLILSVVTRSRVISLPACALQAFLVHLCGTGNLLILTAMAYDRYVAICCPLKYNNIMTPQTLVKIIIIIWVIDLSTIATLLLLLTRFRFCRTNVVDLYCNNPSLTKLVCGDTRVNNYYGVVITVLFQGGTLSFIVFTYVQILRTCIMTNQAEARRKAMQTCASHLAVFLSLQVNTAITLIAHRLTNVSPVLRRALGVSVLIFPPILDPIIYGLKTKELKRGIKMLLRRNGI